MAVSSSIWLLLTMINIPALCAYDGAIVYVKSSGTSTLPCPDQPCFIFNDYARDKTQYFLDGTSFVFLSGVHQLDLQLNLENISNISLCALNGTGSAQIFLSPMINITWLNSSNISISGLRIFLSGTNDNVSLFSALVFTNTTGYLSRLSLLGNDSWQSTAIKIKSSIVELNDVNVSDATSLYGAALFAYSSTVNIIGQNFFINNTATNGGAMFINHNSVINLDGNNSFFSNIANQGGAMCIVYSIINFHGNVLFANNSVNTKISSSACGGAIFCASTVLSFNSSVLFHHNKAIGRLARGGGICGASNSSLIFEASSSTTFTANIAHFLGGALAVTE